MISVTSNMKRLLLAVLLSFSIAAQAHEPGEPLVTLRPYEQGVVDGGSLMAYNISLLNLSELDSGTIPFLCWPFPVVFEDFKLLIEDNVRHQISHLNNRERRKQEALTMYKVWNALQQEYHCYE